MTILFMDGFEIDFPDDTAGLWTSFSRSNSAFGVHYRSTYVRTGTGGCRIFTTASSGRAHLNKTLAASYTEMIIGFGFRWDSKVNGLIGFVNNVVPILALFSSTGNPQIALAINDTTHNLEIWWNGTAGTIIGAGNLPLSADTFYYVELYAKIHDTTGAVTLRVNGNTALDLTGVNTLASAAGDILTLQLGIPGPGSLDRSGAGDFTFDDFIAIDPAGDVAGSWPNGAGIEMLSPTGDGAHSAWASTGVADYTEIDDVAAYGGIPDDDTTKLSDSIVGNRASVTLSDTTIIGTVLGAAILSYVKNSVSGSDAMAQSVRLGGIDYDQPDFIPSTDYAWRQDILVVNPATGLAWTLADLDALEIGVKVS